MNRLVILGAIAAVVIGGASYYFVGFDSSAPEEKITDHEQDFQGQAAQYFRKDDSSWIEMNATSVFKAFVKEGNYNLVDGRKVYNRALFELDPSVDYSEVMLSPQDRIVVVYPIFTATAYAEPGFYTYYRNECDASCLTQEIKNRFPAQANPNSVQVLNLLGYDFITDIDVDKNPAILDQYDKVILLHNEYVTKKEFDAIMSHPNVVYLYPNAMYAEVEMDYAKNTITLVRGHGYPRAEISNGFGWIHDNTPMEYEECKEMSFYKIDNGWMLNCYPENAIHKSMVLLKTIKTI